MSSSNITKILTLALMTASTQISYIAKSHAGFEAHEWGTFTSLVGSNGITQNGMYHEDEQLPQFVHGFGEVQSTPLPPEEPAPPPVVSQPPTRPGHSKGCFESAVYQANKITQKMETPVIYFYADHAQRVDVNVKFPEGVITETYPAPVQTSPSINDANLVLKNGETQFTVDIQDPYVTQTLPSVDADNIYSHARAVDSNFVKTGSEVEKFIFYRGLGRFQPRIHISSQGNSLTLSGPQSALPQAAFLVHVSQNGEGQMIAIGQMSANRPTFVSSEMVNALRAHSSPTNIQPNTHILSAAPAHQALVDALQNAGLKTNEAQAMVNTWEHGYLKVPGLRLLYILPRSEVDEVLPLSMSPAPQNLVRAFVGRIEILLDSDEQKILKDILTQRYDFNVSTLGRFSEPILRRVNEVYRERETPASQDDVALLNTLIDRVSSYADTSTSIH
jgi:hypothetical protein